MLGVDEDGDVIDGWKLREGKASAAGTPDFASVILDNLRTSGVQQAHKENKVSFTSLIGWPGKYKALKTTLKANIDEAAWESLHSEVSRPFPKPRSSRIAVKVINHLGDEVMKVFAVK